MKPTYLYIKRHKVTGLRYFGKTVQDPTKYLGSGKYWTRHIKKHGPEHVETLWHQLFTDRDTLTKTALRMSEELGVVHSDAWANMIIENGLGGGITREIREKLFKEAKEICKKETLRRYRLGRKHSEETKAKMSAAHYKHRSKRYMFLLKTTPEERIRLRDQSHKARK